MRRGYERKGRIRWRAPWVIYAPFEQSLALANMAAMLRPGGVIVVNSGVVPAPPVDPAVGYARVEYSERQYDHIFGLRPHARRSEAACPGARAGGRRSEAVARWITLPEPVPEPVRISP